MIREIRSLILQEMIIEWRLRYAINGMLLYLVSVIFICYLSFRSQIDSLNPVTWNTLFWIIILFAAVNAVTKSFIQHLIASLHFRNTIVFTPFVFVVYTNKKSPLKSPEIIRKWFVFKVQIA